jgi:hypothetical protein
LLIQQFQKTKNFSSISLEIEEKLNEFFIISSLTQNYSLINIQSVHEKCLLIQKGVRIYPNFLAHRTVPHRIVPFKKVL